MLISGKEAVGAETKRRQNDAPYSHKGTVLSTTSLPDQNEIIEGCASTAVLDQQGFANLTPERSRDYLAAKEFRGLRLYQRLGKRTLDIVLAVILLLFLLPIILLAFLAVVLSSGWPGFYASERVGKGRQIFRMWKLRTMQRGSASLLVEWQGDEGFRNEYRRAYKIARDPRVTRVGRFLRRSSLDEIPQLINVIRGEMSLVGHRPITEEELDVNYGEMAEQLLSVRPGLTGPWQIGGRNEVLYPERASMELEYATTCSFSLDLIILFRTLLVPLRFNGR